MGLYSGDSLEAAKSPSSAVSEEKGAFQAMTKVSEATGAPAKVDYRTLLNCRDIIKLQHKARFQ